ncbi:MAG TPA: SH3 domain-containing protein [Casimicrobiaceae bacterium]|nr:SH3 domain-containing protein [Casimicrobiaceae bacterium]
MARRRVMALIIGLALLLPAAAATAQMAYTNHDVNLRAGPNRDFPLVTWIPGGVQVYVNGCLDGWTWCDVTAGPDRGWVYANFLSFTYDGQPVTIISAGPVLGLPLISFSIGTYWDNYYRGRPWYGNRSSWYHRPPNWWVRPPPPRPSRPVVRPPPRPPSNWQPSRPRPPSHGRPPSYRPPNNGRPPSSRPPEQRPQPSRPPDQRPPDRNPPRIVPSQGG